MLECKGDQEVARIISDLQVDIAVDLNGFTQHGRLGILAFPPAPIQVSYLGFPGTTGADFIDYIIADAIASRSINSPTIPNTSFICLTAIR